MSEALGYAGYFGFGVEIEFLIEGWPWLVYILDFVVTHFA